MLRRSLSLAAVAKTRAGPTSNPVFAALNAKVHGWSQDTLQQQKTLALTSGSGSNVGVPAVDLQFLLESVSSYLELHSEHIKGTTTPSLAADGGGVDLNMVEETLNNLIQIVANDDAVSDRTEIFKKRKLGIKLTLVMSGRIEASQMAQELTELANSSTGDGAVAGKTTLSGRDQVKLLHAALVMESSIAAESAAYIDAVGVANKEYEVLKDNDIFRLKQSASQFRSHQFSPAGKESAAELAAANPQAVVDPLQDPEFLVRSAWYWSLGYLCARPQREHAPLVTQGDNNTIFKEDLGPLTVDVVDQTIAYHSPEAWNEIAGVLNLSVKFTPFEQYTFHNAVRLSRSIFLQTLEQKKWGEELEKLGAAQVKKENAMEDSFVQYLYAVGTRLQKEQVRADSLGQWIKTPSDHIAFWNDVAHFWISKTTNPKAIAAIVRILSMGLNSPSKCGPLLRVVDDQLYRMLSVLNKEERYIKPWHLLSLTADIRKAKGTFTNRTGEALLIHCKGLMSVLLRQHANKKKNKSKLTTSGQTGVDGLLRHYPGWDSMAKARWVLQLVDYLSCCPQIKEYDLESFLKESVVPFLKVLTPLDFATQSRLNQLVTMEQRNATVNLCSSVALKQFRNQVLRGDYDDVDSEGGSIRGRRLRDIEGTIASTLPTLQATDTELHLAVRKQCMEFLQSASLRECVALVKLVHEASCPDQVKLPLMFPMLRRLSVRLEALNVTEKDLGAAAVGGPSTTSVMDGHTFNEATSSAVDSVGSSVEIPGNHLSVLHEMLTVYRLRTLDERDELLSHLMGKDEMQMLADAEMASSSASSPLQSSLTNSPPQSQHPRAAPIAADYRRTAPVPLMNPKGFIAKDFGGPAEGAPQKATEFRGAMGSSGRRKSHGKRSRLMISNFRL